MTTRDDPGTPLAAAASRARSFWAYYRRYTDTAIHAAATAALTAFGLLIFIDPSFAWLAIASYLLPPVVLYAIGSDAEADRSPEIDRASGVERSDGRPTTVVDGGSDGDVGGPGREVDATDSDADGIDADTDGPDLDFDGPDRDGPDLDADGIDTDSNGLDADADGPDLDRDG